MRLSVVVGLFLLASILPSGGARAFGYLFEPSHPLGHVVHGLADTRYCKYRRVQRFVPIRRAHYGVYVKNPRYSWRRERVMVRRPVYVVGYRPALYRWSKKYGRRVLVRRGHHTVRVRRAKYRWVRRRVLVRPEKTYVIRHRPRRMYRREYILVKRRGC